MPDVVGVPLMVTVLFAHDAVTPAGKPLDATKIILYSSYSPQLIDSVGLEIIPSFEITLILVKPSEVDNGMVNVPVSVCGPEVVVAAA